MRQSGKDCDVGALSLVAKAFERTDLWRSDAPAKAQMGETTMCVVVPGTISTIVVLICLGVWLGRAFHRITNECQSPNP